MSEKNRYVGTVIYDRTSYGFIKCPDLEENTFYHYSVCVPQEQIHRGDVVEFEIGPGRNGKVQATKVRLLRTVEEYVENQTR